MKTQINHCVLAALMALTGLLLEGCERTASSKEEPVVATDSDALAGCKTYFVTSAMKDGNSVGYQGWVVRCDGHPTTIEKVHVGKTDKTTVVIDGVTYAPVTAP